MKADEEAAICSWLDRIGEFDAEIREDVLSRCRADVEARAYYLQRSTEIEHA